MAERTCSVSGCTARVKGYGWCEKHYTRWRRHGSTEQTRRPVPERLNSGGYVTVYAPDHPLADSTGRVYEHRLSLYRVIGPGAHACHWCATPVYWISGDDRPALQVDHLNWDKLNNEPSNLVPSCGSCNLHRPERPQWGENAPVVKLTESQVREIRVSRESREVLSMRYGVGRTQIGRIQRRERWAKLPHNATHEDV